MLYNRNILLTVAVLLIAVRFAVVAQPPSLEPMLTLPTQVVGATSVASDNYGQHLVGVYSGSVKHFLVGNDGAIIYNTLSVAGGEYPVVTSYGGKVRVTMKMGNDIKIYQSTDGGSTWPTIFLYQNVGVPIYNIDAYSDGRGTHIVWENASDTYYNHELYYVRYDDYASSWLDFKNVTDLASPATGGRPKVTTSTNKAHVGFVGNYFTVSRDLYLPTRVWDSYYVTTSNGAIPLLTINMVNIGDSVFAVGLSDIIVGGGSSQVTALSARHVNDLTWRQDYAFSSTDVGIYTFRNYSGANQGLLWFVNLAGGVVLFSYTPGVGWNWETLENPTGDQGIPFLSVSQFGTYGFWHGSYPSGHLHMRRKPFSITGTLSSKTFLTGNNWFSGASAGIGANVTVEGRSGSVTNILANCTFTQLGTFTINSGASISISSGVTMKFGTAKSLTVYGTISAIGTSGSNIVFTSNSATPQKGDWDRVSLRGGPNTLKYCTVNYSTYGFVIQNTSQNTLEYCTARNSNNYGISAYNTSQNYRYNQIKYCNVSTDNNSGVSVQNARLDFINTTVANNTGWGIVHWSGGNTFMEGTSVTGNTKDGIWVNSSTATARLTPNTGTTPGYNTVQNNDVNNGSYNQINVINGSAFLGDTYQGSQRGGSNTVRGNLYLIKNSTANTIWAQYCSWNDCNLIDGIFQPSPSSFSGPVNAWYCPQTLSSAAFKYAENTLPSILSDTDAESNTPLSASDARNIISILKDRVERGSVGDARDAIHQLAGLVGPGGEHKKELGISWEDYLRIIASVFSSEEVRSKALAFLVQTRMSDMDFDGAIKTATSILTADPDDELWFHCQSEIVSALAAKGDIAGAEAAYERMYVRGMMLNPTATEHLAEVIDFERTGRGMAPMRKTYQRTTLPIPSSFALLQNYPNPFNPATRIEYLLPSAAHVTLRIYDMLGREMVTLVDGPQEAGFKSVRFDGSYLPSGFYFYRLTVGDYTEVMKMVLTK